MSINSIFVVLVRWFNGERTVIGLTDNDYN